MGFPGSSSSRRGRGAAASDVPPAAAVGPLPDADWPAQATDSIVRLVDNVRDRTTGPALTAARVAVYGTVAAILATPLFILLLIGSMRAFEAILEHWFTDPMWIVYSVFGTGFVLLAFFLWGKAKKPYLR